MDRQTTITTVIIVLVFFGFSGIHYGQEQSLPKAAVADAQSYLPTGRIRMDGWIGQRMDDCMNNLVTAWDLNRLIDPFRNKTDAIDDQWRGDYWGKWFTALAWGYAHEPTLAHRQLLDRAVMELIATQGPDGYIGTFEGEKRLVGAYDIWARQCVILGLVAYYDLTNDKTVLDAACRQLDCLIDELKQRELRIPDLSWPRFKGLAPSVVLESGALLYQRTGQQKYRDFAEQIVAQWNEPSKLTPQGLRLIDDALAGKPATELGYPKAYEQMYCFIGVCELYRATGNQKYLNAAVALAKNIRDEELFITGTGSEGENWFKGRSQQTRVIFNPAETCVTTHWMYLCWQLLRLTGDSIYADEMETSLYNALLGALMPDGHWWGYHEGLLGQRFPSWVAQTDVGLSCCVVSGSRGLMLTPFWAVMQTAEGPAVNLYFPGHAETKTPSGGKVQIEMITDYPREGAVQISVKPEQTETFTISLRIPAWSQQTILTVNGQPQSEMQPGTYAKIRRQWTNSDKVELMLDMRTQIVEAPDGNGQVALKRGPIVLALDDRFTPAQNDTQVVLDRDSTLLTNLKPNPDAAQKAGTWMAFDVPFLVNNKRELLTLCDYASAGNQWTKTNRYRTWMPQPLDLGTAYETGDAWYVAGGTPLSVVSPAPKDESQAAIHGCGIKADRILFLGNSITLHGPAPEVYWSGNWGMAASASEKDYVHLLVNSIATLTGKQPETSVNNIADYERNFETYDIESQLKEQLAFKPDIVIVAIGENVPPLNSETLQTKYKAGFLRLLQAIKQSGRPVIYVRSTFWADKIKNNIMRQCCDEVGAIFVDIGYPDRDESNLARSERSYKHAGVAIHPGDKGMKAIADALFYAMTGRLQLK